MHLVLDASVIVKWLLPDNEQEPQSDRAIGLLEAIRRDRVAVTQPVHWLAEVTAVLARLAPELAGEAIALLDAMEFPCLDEVPVYVRAADLAAELDHHVFDTLYHAVALSLPDGCLVTADERYVRKAAKLGRVTSLAGLLLPAA